MSTDTTEITDTLDRILLKVVPPTVKTLADMRWVSQTTGIVHQDQVRQLQLLANLIFEGAVAVISISQDSFFVKVESSGKSSPMTEKFTKVVKWTLGDDWTVQLCYNVKHGPVKARRKGNSAKPKRKKRSSSVRNK